MELLESAVDDEDSDLAFGRDPSEDAVETIQQPPPPKAKRHTPPTQPLPPTPKLDRDGRCTRCHRLPDPMTGICECGVDHKLGVDHRPRP